MANQYTLTDAFSAISETQGTLYNVGDSNIELASAADTTPGQGILLPSGARQTFRGTLYARSMDDAATLNVSDFTEGAGGGDMPVLRFCGSVATYDDLPDDAEQGDVYNIEAANPDHGILAGDNVAWNGTAWDRMAGVYTVMTGASASADGAAGLTPQPLQGDEAKFLRGDATWATEADMTGAAAGTAGAHGLVPAPAAGDNVKFLRGDGSWTQEAVMTGATNAADGEKGLVPKPLTGEEGKFLRGDGTFAHEATMTGATSSVAGAGGLVPAPAAGDDTKFLAGDGTYKQEAVYTGATAGAAGVKGLVPAASLGDLLSFLRSDGTWAHEPTLVGATASTAGAAGLVPAPAAGQEAHVLTGAGTWELPYGFRKPSTAYAVGDIVYVNALAPCKKLVCVAAGTTGSGALTLSSTDEGALNTDGTAVWMVDSLADGNNTAQHKNGVYRGADLTAYWDSGHMSTNIQAGVFVGMYVGDYITKTVETAEKTYTDKGGNSKTIAAATYSNVKWLVAGFDVHLHCGATETTAHHVIMLPASTLQRSIGMNPTNDTTGGFKGSDMWTQILPMWATAIQNAFGSSHVLKHYDYLTKSISSTATSKAGGGLVGAANNWENTEVYVSIPNETMIYGGQCFGSSGYDVGTFPRILPLYALKCNHLDDRSWFWLHDVCSASYFCLANSHGDANYGSADGSTAYGGLRPYFLLY